MLLFSTLAFFSRFLGRVNIAQGSPSACLGFNLGDMPHVSIAEKVYYPANATVEIANAYIGISANDLPAFCRLQVVITTNETAGSVAKTEVWLPDQWNERMLTAGSGGLAGGGRTDVHDAPGRMYANAANF